LYESQALILERPDNFLIPYKLEECPCKGFCRGIVFALHHASNSITIRDLVACHLLLFFPSLVIEGLEECVGITENLAIFMEERGKVRFHSFGSG
jgi:hypothetical protein